jgi:hypothetical protein
VVSIEGPDGGVDITGATPVVFSCAVSKEEFAISDITYLLIELKLCIFPKSPGAVRADRVDKKLAILSSSSPITAKPCNFSPCSLEDFLRTSP